MLKKITTEQLCLGMYIQELDGSWIDHPFWRKSFLLERQVDLDSLIAGSVGHFFIDTSKGLDIAEEDSEEESEEASDEDAAPSADADITPEPPSAIWLRRLTAEQEHENAIKILAAGKAAITSMFEEVRMGKVVDTQDVLPLVEDVMASISRNTNALISIVRLKTADDYTYMHSVAVCAMMAALARECGLSAKEARQAGVAGLLHDIGKTAIPAHILKKPGPLTDAEFNIVRSHPVAGYKLLLEGRGVDEVALDVCLHHHEKIDGGGYPHRLQDKRISLYAKMAAVCDVYDAVTSNRPYKPGWDPGQSLKRMAAWKKSHFDNRVFHAFVRIVGIYPVGSLVRMRSDRLGVVIGHNASSLLQPRVRLFFSIKDGVRIPVEKIDLANRAARDEIISHESPGKWNLGPQDLWC
jgi:putative nucleotidyltransferase with HDIG domain